MMDPKVKEDWLDALRNGEYEQTTDALENDGRNCCLGVLMDLNDDVDHLPTGTLIGNPGFVYAGKVFWGFPPWQLLKSVNLKHHEASRLASLNDNGHSFEAIADYIEATL